jgi:O-succinylbenzoic acid--CoA ligase
MLLRCYRNGDDPKDADGWFATGDLGEWTHDGRLSVVGRRGDLIITGGENVWPESVEAALRSHPEVSDVMVVGADDAEWGQLVEAIVVPVPGTTPTLDGLRGHVKERHPAHLAPKRLTLVDTIPRTTLGKPIRPKRNG